MQFNNARLEIPGTHYHYVKSQMQNYSKFCLENGVRISLLQSSRRITLKMYFLIDLLRLEERTFY